jgi:hypothetical protein
MSSIVLILTNVKKYCPKYLIYEFENQYFQKKNRHRKS